MTIVSYCSTLLSASSRVLIAVSAVAMTVSSNRRMTWSDGTKAGSSAHRRYPPTLLLFRMVISDHAVASEELVLEGECAGGGSRRHVELREDVLQVPGDGVLADDEGI